MSQAGGGQPAARSAQAANHLLRPQLIDLINRAEDFPLTVLLAPAGSGKSTLLRQWMHSGRQASRFAVLNLDARHNAPVPFFASLIKVIKQSCNSIQRLWLI